MTDETQKGEALGGRPWRDGEELVELVLRVVESIPRGRVMTYGDVAAAVGSRAARAVGQVMARYGSDVPWWRVVRAGGHPPRCHGDRALEHYETEGTPILGTAHSREKLDYRIDLAAARWHP